jgi:hypothetical protein
MTYYPRKPCLLFYQKPLRFSNTINTNIAISITSITKQMLVIASSFYTIIIPPRIVLLVKMAVFPLALKASLLNVVHNRLLHTSLHTDRKCKDKSCSVVVIISVTTHSLCYCAILSDTILLCYGMVLLKAVGDGGKKCVLCCWRQLEMAGKCVLCDWRKVEMAGNLWQCTVHQFPFVLRYE